MFLDSIKIDALNADITGLQITKDTRIKQYIERPIDFAGKEYRKLIVHLKRYPDGISNSDDIKITLNRIKDVARQPKKKVFV